MIGAILDRLKVLGRASAFSDSERVEIERMYADVLDMKFVRTSCNDCYRDAVFEMYSYLKRNGKMKEKSVYKLKNGALIQMEFGSGEFYTNATLTDEVAERYLRKYPERINLFAVYPDDWMERVKDEVKPKKEKRRKV